MVRLVDQQLVAWLNINFPENAEARVAYLDDEESEVHWLVGPRLIIDPTVLLISDLSQKFEYGFAKHNLLLHGDTLFIAHDDLSTADHVLNEMFYLAVFYQQPLEQHPTKLPLSIDAREETMDVVEKLTK